METSHQRGRSWCAILIASAPILVVMSRLIWAGDLSRPLPIHWTADGRIDGSLSPTSFYWIFLAAATAFAIFGVMAALRGAVEQGYSLLLITTFGSWFCAVMYTRIVLIARGAGDSQPVHVTVATSVSMVLAGIAAAASARLLVPRARVIATHLPSGDADSSVGADSAAVDRPFDEERPGAGSTARQAVYSSIVSAASTVLRALTHADPSYAVGSSDSRRAHDSSPENGAFWIGGASSRGLFSAAVVLLIGAIVASFASPTVAALLIASALALSWVQAITVRVDGSAVTILWGPGGRSRTVLPLSEITSVHCRDLGPDLRAWGGSSARTPWGGDSAVVRVGPGVVLELIGRPSVAIAVDDAADAAKVMHHLVARNHP